MNKYRYLIAAILLSIVVLLVYILDTSSRQARKKITCSNIEIKIKDSTDLQFVSVEDIKSIVNKEYGTYLGKNIDSIKLHQLEEILHKKSSIKKTDVYVTNDGCLHIMIEQREPIVKLNTKNGVFFVDDRGFIFPAKSRYKSKIPVVEGDIPIEKNWKGIPTNKKEQVWITNLICMLQYLNKDKNWSEGISQIKVDSNGNLTLKPRVGKELFFFGPPDHYEEKFSRITDYYRYIVPEKGEYSLVNVKYKGQIICK